MTSLFPPSCVCCGGRLLGAERYVCTSCISGLPHLFLGDDPRDNVFVRRFWSSFPAESAASLLTYMPGSELTKIVHKMKYGNRPELCRLMGRLMACDDLIVRLLSDADVLVPVPITPQRYRERGYNQSEQMCIGISEVVPLPIITTAIKRIRFVESQTVLSRAERLENVKGAFELSDASVLQGRHVVLVDDIITTGATTMECMQQMRSVPGVKVSILSLAWTGGHW